MFLVCLVWSSLIGNLAVGPQRVVLFFFFAAHIQRWRANFNTTCISVLYSILITTQLSTLCSCDEGALGRSPDMLTQTLLYLLRLLVVLYVCFCARSDYWNYIIFILHGQSKHFIAEFQRSCFSVAYLESLNNQRKITTVMSRPLTRQHEQYYSLFFLALFLLQKACVNVSLRTARGLRDQLSYCKNIAGLVIKKQPKDANLDLVLSWGPAVREEMYQKVVIVPECLIIRHYWPSECGGFGDWGECWVTASDLFLDPNLHLSSWIKQELPPCRITHMIIISFTAWFIHSHKVSSHKEIQNNLPWRIIISNTLLINYVVDV